VATVRHLLDGGAGAAIGFAVRASRKQTRFRDLMIVACRVDLPRPLDP